MARIDWPDVHYGFWVALGVIAVLGIGVGIYFGWRHYQTSDPLGGLQPGIYQGQSNGGETLPLPGTRKP